MKPVDVKPSMYINFNKENNKEKVNLKLVMLEYQNAKTEFPKAMFQIGLKKMCYYKS